MLQVDLMASWTRSTSVLHGILTPALIARGNLAQVILDMLGGLHKGAILQTKNRAQSMWLDLVPGLHDDSMVNAL